MPAFSRLHLTDVRGASRLLIDASTGIVDVVERMHRTIQRRPGPLGQAIDEATRGITGLVYQSVRGSMRVLGRGLDASLSPVAAVLPDGEHSVERDVVVSVLNGLYGDHLARTDNPLAIEMSLRLRGARLDPEDPSITYEPHARAAAPDKLLLLVHGLCMSEHQWVRDGFGHGSALAEEFGYIPIYVRYNSGLHIAENGQLLSERLERLLTRWPRQVSEVAIIGHSLGGLVARSGLHAAQQRGHAWPVRLRRLVFLGTPHLGAPLERGGHRLDYLLELSPYSAPFTRFGKIRSDGIKDLRHGNVGADGETVQLPDDVACYAVAATIGAGHTALADRLLGDGLVPLDSALGRHRYRCRSLQFAQSRQWVGHGMGHLELLHRPEVYARLREWFAEPAKPDVT
jgi:pimeloyl-ACP methyl ester carboxylesterase